MMEAGIAERLMWSVGSWGLGPLEYRLKYTVWDPTRVHCYCNGNELLAPVRCTLNVWLC